MSSGPNVCLIILHRNTLQVSYFDVNELNRADNIIIDFTVSLSALFTQHTNILFGNDEFIANVKNS